MYEDKLQRSDVILIFRLSYRKDCLLYDAERDRSAIAKFLLRHATGVVTQTSATAASY